MAPIRLVRGGDGITQSDLTRRFERGGRWRDPRQVIDAIAFKFRTGTQ
ncbi:hypothetical protein [Streptomyces anulatus]